MNWIVQGTLHPRWLAALLLPLALCSSSAFAQELATPVAAPAPLVEPQPATPSSHLLLNKQAAGENAELELVIHGQTGLGNDAGWRMMASPSISATRGDLEDDINLDVAEGSPAALYTWNGDQYQAATSSTALPPGRGFVVYLFDDEYDPIDPILTLDVPGPANTSDVEVPSLPLDARFHLLGNPFTNAIDLPALQLPEHGFQATVQIANPATSSYVLRSEGEPIAAWQGFFTERTALGAGDTTLTFPVSAQTDGGTFIGKQAAQRPVIDFDLTGQDGEGTTVMHDEAIRVFFDKSAHAGWDIYEATKLPPLRRIPSVLLAFLSEKDDEPVELAQASFSPALSEPIALQAALLPYHFEDAAPVQMELRWTDASLPDAWELTLVDHVADAQVDLRVEDTYRFTFDPSNIASHRFTLHVDEAETPSSSDEEPRLAQSSLLPLYPNPTSGPTTIRYRLARSSEVRVSVYDILGREVTVLLSGYRTSGQHEVQWTPTGLPSGTYFVRLETVEGVYSRRALITQ